MDARITLAWAAEDMPRLIIPTWEFGAVIVANAIVARFVKDPTEPRFIWRAVPIQL